MKALLVLVVMFLGASAHLCPKTCADNSTVQLRRNYAIEPCTGHVAWYKLGSYCVKHINQMLDYTSAENHCKSVKSGAHLVSIHSAEDNNAVDEFSQWSSRHNPRIWLGGHAVNDPSQASNFLWVDGSDMNFSAWIQDPKQPSGDGRCMEMNWLETGKWNDKPCSQNNFFVCAFKPDGGHPRVEATDRLEHEVSQLKPLTDE
ncbi:lectin-like [Oncorhynchus masou masou]|uniref:lectin-like n=1 Tax=Oncorhynchus masou masou TaxID=90313 RepID=UPI0031830330